LTTSGPQRRCYGATVTTVAPNVRPFRGAPA
jgi:hypothetical protein